MLNLLKPIIAFIVALIALLLFYYLVSLPILPCISTYIAALLFSPSPERPCYVASRVLRTVLILIISVLGFLFYASNLVVTIKITQNLNLFFIITEALTALSFIGAFFVINKANKTDL